MVNVGTVNADAGLTVNPSGFAAYAAALRSADSQVTDFANTSKNAFSGLSVGLAAATLGIAGEAVKLASSFQDAGTTLTTLYGSADIAKEKFAWMTDFAAQTPFEFSEIEEGAIKLKAYGMDIEKYGKTFGDTASAMGKSFDQVIEAVADAQTGEFERLKELGIKAVQVQKGNLDQYTQYGAKVGDTMLTYVDKNGKQMAQAVDRNNREMITSTLSAIWNDKYAGAMETRSKTLSGLAATLKDNLSMGLASLAGYDMKNMEVASASLLGVLQSLAGVAVDLTSGLSNIGPAGRVFITVVAAGVVAVGAVTGAMMIWNAVSAIAVTANLTLGAAFATAFLPVTAIIAGVALLAAGLYILNEKTGIVSKAFQVLKDAFTIVVYYIKSAASDLSTAVTNQISEITEAFKNIIPQSVIDDVTKFYNWASELIGKVTDAIHGKATSITDAATKTGGGKTGQDINNMSNYLDVLNSKTDTATQKMENLNNVNMGSILGQLTNLGDKTQDTAQKAADLNVKLTDAGQVSINGTIGQFAVLDSTGKATNTTLTNVLTSLQADGNVSMAGSTGQLAIVDSTGKTTIVTTQQLAEMLKQAGNTSMNGTVSGINSIAEAWKAAKTSASNYAAAAMEMGHSINEYNKAVKESYSAYGGKGNVTPDGIKIIPASQSKNTSVTNNTTINVNTSKSSGNVVSDAKRSVGK